MEDGRLISLGAASAASDPDLTQAALDAVRLWTYEPTLWNGQAVEVVTTNARHSVCSDAAWLSWRRSFIFWRGPPYRSVSTAQSGNGPL